MHSYVRHTSFIRATWLSTFLGAFECATVSFIQATCLILTRLYKLNIEFTNFVRAHPWDLRFAYSCVLHGSSMSVTWRTHVYDTTIIRTWLTPCARTDRLSHSCHALYSHHHSESRQIDPEVLSDIWISLVTRMNVSCHTHEWVMSHIWMCHATHMNESCHTHEWVMSHIWMIHVTHMSASPNPNPTFAAHSVYI